MQKAATRRMFLRNSVALMSAAGVPAKAAANERVNLGMIGLGMRGMHTLLPTFHAMTDTNIVAGADCYDGRLESAREATDGKIWTTKDYRAILDRKDIDAVVIATPDHWHARMVLDALSAGKDVFCEKPLTWSIEEGATLRKAVNNSRQILQVGSQHKTAPSTLTAKRIVKSGELGEINMVRSFQHRSNAEGAWRYPIPPDASLQTVEWSRFLGSAPQIPWSPERFFRWRCWWEYSGGVATDLFVHNFTAIHEILGLTLPQSVAANGGIFRWKDGRNVPDVLNAVLEYPEGITVDMCVNLCYAGPGNTLRGTQIIGSKATMYVGAGGGGAPAQARGSRAGAGRSPQSPAAGAGSIQIYPEPPSVEGAQPIPLASWPKKMRLEYFAAHGAGPDGRPLTPPPAAGDPKIVQIENDGRPSFHEYFIKSVKDRSPSIENVDEGHYAAAAAHMCNRSYREGRRITVDKA
jgi:predicted dehydrogenase